MWAAAHPSTALRGVSRRAGERACGAEPGHERTGIGVDDAAMVGLPVGVAGMVLTGSVCRLTTAGRPPRGIAGGAGRRCRRASRPWRVCVPQRHGDGSGSRGAVLDGRERAARSRTGSATKPQIQLHRRRQKPPYRQSEGQKRTWRIGVLSSPLVSVPWLVVEDGQPKMVGSKTAPPPRHESYGDGDAAGSGDCRYRRGRRR